MSRINQKLEEDKKLFSAYFTACYPNIGNTVSIIQNLEKSNVDVIEIGLINMFLITPQTSDERIRFIDSVSDGFI